MLSTLLFCSCVRSCRAYRRWSAGIYGGDDVLLVMKRRQTRDTELLKSELSAARAEAVSE
jgi:hypothetical protein